MTQVRLHLTRVALGILSLGLILTAPAQATINGINWLAIGPAPAQGFRTGGASGRATAIAVNPENELDIWLGTAGGGVWHSVNGGDAWTAMSDDQASLAVGAIALADCNPGGCGRVYVGTGENGIRRDTYYGMGLLVGTFSGGAVSWVRRTAQPTYNFSRGSIDNVVLDPRFSGAEQVIYITLSSGVTASASESTVTAPETCFGKFGSKNFCVGGYGIYKSTNNGKDWDKLPVPGVQRETPTDLKMDPTDPDVLYAGFMGLGIFKTTDGGATWCPMNPGIPRAWTCPDVQGLPSPHSFDHVEMLAYPGGGLFATFGMCPDRLLQDCYPDVYYAYSPGTVFYRGSSGASFLGCPVQYSRYTHGLANDPFHGEILLGGLHLCYTPTGGATWSTNETLAPNANQTLHFDHHTIVYHPNKVCYVYETNDGGPAVSFDCAISWWPKNNALQTIEFQAIATSPKTPLVIGGTQDNGGMMWKGPAIWDTLPCCGDAGFSVMDLDNAQTMYITTNLNTGPGVFGYVPMRSLDGGVNFKAAYSPILDGEPRSFYPPLVQDPDPKQSTVQHPLYFGTNRLWKSTDDATTWTPVSPVLSTDPETEIVSGVDVITAIAVAPGKPGHVYIGYYSGKVFATTSACTSSSCWPSMSSGLPAAPITWIAVDPADENTAYVTVSGFAPGIHVYRTTNGGQSWTQAGSHPDLSDHVPANTISVEPGATNRLWLGTDRGIYKSETSGQSWFRFSNGLPNVPVYQIAIDPAHDRVIAATHGRGAFILTGPYLNNYLGCAGETLSNVVVYGNAFPSNQACTMQILRRDGSACTSASPTDAQGGIIHTNNKGELVRTIPNVVTDQPLIWACAGGQCLGGGSVASCNPPNNPLTTIVATCGAALGVDIVGGCPVILSPPSSVLALSAILGGSGNQSPAHEACFDPALAGGGFFLLRPSVQSGDGSSRVLCSVSVPFTSNDSAGMVLQNAGDAVNADPGCQASGVSAEVEPAVLEPEVEDIFPQPASLHLLAPTMTGGQLVPALQTGPGQATGTCFSLDNLGAPVTNQLGIARIRFTTSPTGAQGGTLTLRERSGLGDCSITVPTGPGDTPMAIAGALAAAFQAGGTPGPYPDCPAAANPRDIVGEGESVVIAAASRIEICANDAGVGVSAAPKEICFTDADCEDGNPCTRNTCDISTGRCQSTSEPDGLPCDDRNVCTIGDACVGGVCGRPVDCDDRNSCTTDSCDTNTGRCLNAPVICDDQNPCTRDVCNPDTGRCLFSPTAGAACDDGDPCTTGDMCVSVPGTGSISCEGMPRCADSDPCTTDLCDRATGGCLNQPIQCDDGNPCTLDSCEGGACTTFPLFGAVCDDEDGCTFGDTCVADASGAPVCRGQAVVCDDENVCTVDQCNPITGGCDHTPVPLSEVQGLELVSSTTMSWSLAPGVTFWDTYRGTIPSGLLGGRPRPPYDQACFEMDDTHGDGSLVSTDAENPPVGTAFYYDVTLVTRCGEGPIGSDSNTTLIPNASPCGPVP